MCTIRERKNSFAALCNWICELSNSIEELSYTANTPAICKNNGIIFQLQLQSSLIELQSSLNQFKDELNKRAL